MRDLTGERVGTALRALAQDLVAERRRVAELERENRQLRHELEQLRRAAAQREIEAALSR